MAYTDFTPRIQLDGSPMAGFNCNTTEAANVAIADQRGIRPVKGTPWPPTGATVRAATHDTVGGTTLGQVDVALGTTYGYLELDLDVRYRLPIGDFVSMVGPGGKPAILQGASRATRATPFQGSETFIGNHSWGIFGHRGTWPNGETLIHDPLWNARRPGIPDNHFRWIPDHFVAAFAAWLDLDGKGHLLGPGLVYAAFGDAWLPPAPAPGVPAPKLVYRYGGQPRSRGMKRVDVSRARLRRSPYNRADNVLRTIARGFRFRCHQTTLTGTSVRWRENGTGRWRSSRKWHGDITGRVWIHESNIDPVAA